MTRREFDEIVAETLDSLPAEFRDRLENVAVVVQDAPPTQQSPRTPRPHDVGSGRKLLLGIFEGIPRTQQSVFALPIGPARIVLFQENIEAVCRSEAEIRRQIRLTVIHEIGHYFGMSEEQLRDV
ncbi:MAG: metallopeptidase family protein [Terriglobales bacterium]